MDELPALFLSLAEILGKKFCAGLIWRAQVIFLLVFSLIFLMQQSYFQGIAALNFLIFIIFYFFYSDH